MKFLVPLGLLALISVVILIILHIIRPKYREVTVSSTYIWKLSLKYLKKRKNIKWIRNSLLLLLQILILTSLAFMLARPYTLSRGRSGEKIIIIDASASMTAGGGSGTRFDRAVADARSLAGSGSDEDPVTVIWAGSNTTAPVYRETSLQDIRKALEALEVTEGSVSIAGALDLAREIRDISSSADVYLYTDMDYTESGGVEIVNVSAGEWNVSVTGLGAVLTGGYYVFRSDVLNCGRQADFDAVLVIDGQEAGRKRLSLGDGEKAELIFDASSDVRVYEFREAYVRLDAADSLAADNISFTFGSERRREIELVSAYSLIPAVALSADPLNNVYQVDPEIGNVYTSGYDMYIFEKKLPEVMPTDGGLLLLDPESSGLGLTLGSEVTGDFMLAPEPSSAWLTEGIGLDRVRVTKYRRLSSYDGFEVLATVNGDPVLLTRSVGNVKFTVMLFDLHYSDLPALAAWPLLLKRINDYSAPRVLSSRNFTVGDQVVYATKPNCTETTVSFRDIAGQGADAEAEEYLSFGSGSEAAFIPDRAGYYTLTQRLDSGKVRTDSFYVEIPSAESDFNRNGGVIVFEEGSGGSDDPANRNEWFFYLAAALLALIVTEWLVQYREQV